MVCPIKRRNGRMVLGVVIVGTMLYSPPKSAGDVALYGIGTLAGLMITDSITSGGWNSGCGCRMSMIY